MDPPLVNEASFTAAANPSSYSLAGLLSFPTSGGGLGLRMGSFGRSGGDGSLEESTVTEQSGSGNEGAKRKRDVGGSFEDTSAKLASTSDAFQDVVILSILFNLLLCVFLSFSVLFFICLACYS